MTRRRRLLLAPERPSASSGASPVALGNLAVQHARGRHSAGSSIRSTYHSAERVYSVIEGSKAAIHWRVRVSSPGGEPVPTEMLDVWEFAEDGKVRSLVQFIDTALAGAMFA